MWLCPVKHKSWLAVRRNRVFGVPRRFKERMLEVKRNDILVFHLLGSGSSSGVVAAARVISEMFESYHDLWGKGLYPMRVRIEFLPGFTRSSKSAIPLNLLFGANRNSSGTFEPYLRNVCMAQLTRQQYAILKALFKAPGSKLTSHRK